MNLLKLIGLLLIPAQMLVTPDWLNIILSMLFIPSRNADGAIETFYGVGWTLNFEMFFYLIFAMGLMLRLRPFVFVTVVMVGAVAMSYLREADWPAVTYLFNAIVIHFVWGVLIAEIYKRGFYPGLKTAATAMIMICAGLWAVFDPPEMKLFGLQYASLVAGVVFLEHRIRGHIPKALIFGGDASYSLYLMHPMVGVFIVILLARLGISSAWVAIALIVIACIAVSSLTYLWFEKPVTTYLKKKYLWKGSSASVISL